MVEWLRDADQSSLQRFEVQTVLLGELSLGYQVADPFA